jgi:hypothetical protein
VQSGIVAIDRLLTDGAAPAIQPTDREAVAAVQALLIGHGYSRLPTMLSPSCGVFGPQTTDAVRHFQTSQQLPMTGAVEAVTMRAMVTADAIAPVVSRVYVACVLDVADTGLLSLATVTMQLEGGGYFSAANWNTDRCGLSFGLIQWAQRPGRLHELLAAFQAGAPLRCTEIFGEGDPAVVQGLLAHTKLPNGGVDPRTGLTTDNRYNLIAAPWSRRFLAAGRDRMLQRIQIETALAAFRRSAQRIRQTMPVVQSERGLVFMLDVANQFGDGGAAKLATAVTQPGMTETEFLLAVERESVARVAAQYGAGSAFARSTADRRQTVRTTPWLKDDVATFA